MLGLFEIDRSYREVYEDSRVSTSDNIERWFVLFVCLIDYSLHGTLTTAILTLLSLSDDYFQMKSHLLRLLHYQQIDKVQGLVTYQRVRSSVVTCQAAMRGTVARVSFLALRKAAVSIQCVVRSFISRRQLRLLNRYVYMLG